VIQDAIARSELEGGDVGNNEVRLAGVVNVARSGTVRESEIREIVIAGRAVRAMGSAWGRPVEKLNVAAIGNIVAQLHVHVVGRRADDPAWPGPVWGFGTAEPLREENATAALAAALSVLGA
jgi:hypothetical protein